MSMKSLLVPIVHRDTMRSTLESALLLAKRFDSYIEGFALQFRISEFVVVDMGGSFPLDSLKQENLEEANRTRAAFEAFMQERGVPRAGQAGLSYGWLDQTPGAENFVGSYGRVFDAIVMGRPEASATGLQYGAIESALFESGRPLLLAPSLPPRQIGGNILIAWNRSTEQTRATAFAMPLLQQAGHVTVLTVAGGTGVSGPSAEQLIQYLRRHGIAATPLTVELEGKSTGEAILAAATSLGCDLLIKGAYTQSRLRQMIFGGATRHVLAHATLPVLLAH